MKDLFEWHFAEEIEHKSVIFDLQKSVRCGYVQRAVGLVLAHFLILGFAMFGLLLLLHQDRLLFKKNTLGTLYKEVSEQNGLVGSLLRNGIDYLRPSFHPWNFDNMHLAEAILARMVTEKT
jgi:hypothetical protein